MTREHPIRWRGMAGRLALAGAISALLPLLGGCIGGTAPDGRAGAHGAPAAAGGYYGPVIVVGESPFEPARKSTLGRAAMAERARASAEDARRQVEEDRTARESALRQAAAVRTREAERMRLEESAGRTARRELREAEARGEPDRRLESRAEQATLRRGLVLTGQRRNAGERMRAGPPGAAFNEERRRDASELQDRARSTLVIERQTRLRPALSGIPTAGSGVARQVTEGGVPE